jgi:hypothetical protein
MVEKYIEHRDHKDGKIIDRPEKSLLHPKGLKIYDPTSELNQRARITYNTLHNTGKKTSQSRTRHPQIVDGIKLFLPNMAKLSIADINKLRLQKVFEFFLLRKALIFSRKLDCRIRCEELISKGGQGPDGRSLRPEQVLAHQE